MSDSKLESYRRAEQSIPTQMLRWHLYGAGLESLGKDGRPEQVTVPEYGPNELLVRQDACGLCFSDTKVIAQGPNHPRLIGRDLATNPVTLGHEVSCTVVGVGENLKERFQVGQRFVVQADVFYQGQSMAYGYVINGGLAEYSVIPRPLIEGDEGCYLLPIREDTGYVESALTEPWACVVAAYAQTHRNGIKPGGRMLVLGGSEAARQSYDWQSLLTPDHRPRTITVSPDLTGFARDGLMTLAEMLTIPVEWSPFDWAGMKLQSLQASMMHNHFEKYDDIIILGGVEPEVIEGTALALADHGILNLVTNQKIARKVSIDIGRIHYDGHHYVGTNSACPGDAYLETRTADLVPDGNCWIIGAGGPMGQMHLQRALQLPKPPRLLLATDVDTNRLGSAVDRFGKLAKDRQIEFVTLNPSAMSPADFKKQLLHLTAGWGFNDIISLVSISSIIEEAAEHLADGGWFNIFAGVPRGVMAQLDMNVVAQSQCRFMGSSGSSLADMRETLACVERDELSTNASLAAIGGMNAAREGLRAVKEGWFSGKTLIFPQIHDLPLTPLPKLKEKYPTVYAKLKDGQFWTEEAEEELLRLLLT